MKSSSNIIKKNNEIEIIKTMPGNLMLFNKALQLDNNKYSYQRIGGIKQQLSKGYHHKTSVF